MWAPFLSDPLKSEGMATDLGKVIQAQPIKTFKVII